MKKVRLGKTALKMLAEIKPDTKFVFTCLVGGHGHGGGRMSGGHRESRAACKLRDAGYLVFVSHHESLDASNGWTTRYTEAKWEVTAAGRLAAAELNGVKS